MSTPVEWGSAALLAGVLALVFFGLYAGVLALLLLAVILATVMLVRAALSAYSPPVWAVAAIVTLTVVAISGGAIVDTLLGIAMFVSAVAGLTVGFLFRAKGWW